MIIHSLLVWTFSTFSDVGKWNDDACYVKKNYMYGFKVMKALTQTLGLD